MRDHDPKTLLALGLDPSVELEPLDSVQWAEGIVGHGFGANEPIDWFLRPEHISTERVAFSAFETATGGELRRHRETGGIAYLEVPQAQFRWTGDVRRLGNHAVVVDARQKPAHLRIDIPWFSFFLDFKGNCVEAKRMPVFAPQLFEERPPILAPEIDAILGHPLVSGARI